MAALSDDHSVTPIRDLLRERGHTKWGFVIYRCTYDNDAAWTRFMQILGDRARSHLADSDALDLMLSLDWRVQDDAAMFDGASKDQIRDHFKAWVASDDATAEQPDQVPPLPTTMLHQTPRYAYCIHVDAAALDSVVRQAPQPPEWDRHGVGYVNLIDEGWEMPDPTTYDYEFNGLDPEVDDPTDEGEEEVEGCKMTDVGWMKVRLEGMVPGLYATLQKSGAYYAVYRRPPEVCTR